MVELMPAAGKSGNTRLSESGATVPMPARTTQVPASLAIAGELAEANSVATVSRRLLIFIAFTSSQYWFVLSVSLDGEPTGWARSGHSRSGHAEFGRCLWTLFTTSTYGWKTVCHAFCRPLHGRIDLQPVFQRVVQHTECNQLVAESLAARNPDVSDVGKEIKTLHRVGNCVSQDLTHYVSSVDAATVVTLVVVDVVVDAADSRYAIQDSSDFASPPGVDVLT